MAEKKDTVAKEKNKCSRRGKKNKTRPCFVVTDNDEAVEDSKVAIPIDSNLYLLKTSNTDKSIYEFPSQEEEPESVLTFLSKMDKRRNAVCEETPKQVHDTLEMYFKLKKLNDIIL